MSSTPTVKCPTCKSLTEFSSKNPFRPFCSERCSTLDLGAWAQEQYRVAGEPTTEVPTSNEVNENQNSPRRDDSSET